MDSRDVTRIPLLLDGMCESTKSHTTRRIIDSGNLRFIPVATLKTTVFTGIFTVFRAEFVVDTVLELLRETAVPPVTSLDLKWVA